MAGKYKPGYPWNLAAAVREIRWLQMNRDCRDQRQAFFAEGARNFVQAVDHRHDIVLIFYSDKLLTNPLARKFVRQLRREGVPTLQVSPEGFRQVSRTQRASGIGAIVRQRWTPLRSIHPRQGLCWVVVGQVRSAGNLGTLIRTSEAVSGAGFILLDRATDPFDPSVVRASTGAIFRQSFVRTERQELSRWTETHQCQVIGASPDGTDDLHHFDYPPNSVLILGEERLGLTTEQREMCDSLVRIPMAGRCDSLNLGVAGSLLMYELFRSQGGGE